MRWSQLALRTRATLLAALVLLLGLSAGSVLLVTALRSALVAGLDDAALTRVGDARAALARGDAQAAVSRAGGESSFVQVRTTGGDVIASSPDLPRGAAGVARRSATPMDVQLGDREYRVVAQTAGAYVVVVLSPMDDVEEATRRLSVLVAVGAPVLLAVVCGGIWSVVGYTLRTVDRLRTQVADLSSRALGRRVDVPEPQDEVRRLAETMNALLQRLDESSRAQRQFVADAAHELRSPLTAVRTRLEVNARLQDARAWDDAVPDLLGQVDRLGGLVDDLLALARLDEAAPLHRRASVDLDELVFDAVRPLRGVLPVTLDTSAVGAGLVHGDPELLARIVGNLLSNAVRHARSTVTVRLRTVDEHVHLVVSDDGPGIPAHERERVFERFHRLQTDRGRGSGGSGLGLAIVHDAVRAHAGQVWVDDVGPGAAVHVVLPRDTS